MQLQVFVQPGAKRDLVEKQEDLLGMTIYKVWTRAKPIDGEANEAVVFLLAEYFSVKKHQIQLMSGASSRRKIFEILGFPKS